MGGDGLGWGRGWVGNEGKKNASTYGREAECRAKVSLSKRFERPGLADFPGSIPPLTATAEPALIFTLSTELSSKFKLELDSEPVLSRELTLSPNLPKTSGEILPLFIGGSNADRLASAAANVGVVPDTVTEGGWVLNTTSVSIALPQIEAYCLTLPAEAPVII